MPFHLLTFFISIFGIKNIGYFKFGNTVAAYTMKGAASHFTLCGGVWCRGRCCCVVVKRTYVQWAMRRHLPTITHICRIKTHRGGGGGTDTISHLLGISGDDSTARAAFAAAVAAAADDDVGGVSVSLRRRLLSFETTIL